MKFGKRKKEGICARQSAIYVVPISISSFHGFPNCGIHINEISNNL